MWPHVRHGAVAYLAPGIFSVFLIFVVIASAGTPSKQVLDILHVRKDDFETKYSYFSETDRLRMVQASRDMFYFGYDNYLDEVCVSSGWAEPDMQWTRACSARLVILLKS
jgi:hypothetical protein